ncbi:MAG: Uma2 family endonuclease [Sandaracinus sp.]
MTAIDVALDLPGSEGLIRRLRRREYDQLVEAGAFDGEKVELIRGVLVRMTPQGVPHAAVIQRLNAILLRALGDRAVVRPQLPLLGPEESEPEPDFAVVAPGEGERSHPATALLVIEVAASSLVYDRDTKGRLYAEMAVPEYWIVDLAGRCIEVHRAPSEGRYQRVDVVRPGEAIQLVSFPDVSLVVADVLR